MANFRCSSFPNARAALLVLLPRITLSIVPVHSRPPPAPKPKRLRAKKLPTTATRAKYLHTLPDLSPSELDLVLGLWDDLGDEMRGVPIHRTLSATPRVSPRRPHVALVAGPSGHQGVLPGGLAGGHVAATPRAAP